VVAEQRFALFLIHTGEKLVTQSQHTILLALVSLNFEQWRFEVVAVALGKKPGPVCVFELFLLE
jgi:hypothetical protein